MSSSVTSRARRSTFGTTPSDRRCDTNDRHPQPEVSQLSPFLSRNRKDLVRLTPAGTTTIVTDPPFRKSLDSRIPIWTLRIHKHGESILRRIIPTKRIMIRTSSLGIRTCNLDHLFQRRRYLISLCHARAYALPTHNGNYQLLRWIN